MFRYNWDCLYKCCKNNCDLIIDILEYYAGKKVTSKASKIIYKIAKCEKTAFISDLKGLLKDTTATNEDKCIYLYLASKRNIADYYLYADDTLALELASIEDVEKLTLNPLIKIESNKIIFKY